MAPGQRELPPASTAEDASKEQQNQQNDDEHSRVVHVVLPQDLVGDRLQPHGTAARTELDMRIAVSGKRFDGVQRSITSRSAAGQLHHLEGSLNEGRVSVAVIRFM
jgi:hypothetical protein